MVVTRYNPLNDFKKSIEVFNNLFNVNNNNIQTQETEIDFFPTVNSREDDKAFYLDVDLPGVKKKDIELNITDGVLTIKGERKTRNAQEDKTYYKIESSYGKFERSFTLPKDIDESKIEAEVENGVLSLTIPKSAQDVQKTKKIAIK